MSTPNPTVSLATGKVSWVAPTANTDGSALSAGEITGYVVGLRSTTAAGSVVGTYPIQSPLVPPTELTDALSAIASGLKSDSYAIAVQAESANGPSAWSSEVLFTGTLPVPNAPTGVSVQ